MDLTNRRWGLGALLAFLAAVLLTLAAFLPHFQAESVAGPDDTSTLVTRLTVTSWGSTTTIDQQVGEQRDLFAIGYQQLFGVALALLAGLFAATLARKTARGRTGAVILFVAAAAFNAGLASIIVSLLNSYADFYPATSGPNLEITSSLGLGAWLLFAGVLVAVAAAVVVLIPKREPASVEDTVAIAS